MTDGKVKNWGLLRKNCCPCCGSALEFNEHDEMMFCGTVGCQFQISEYRMESIVADMNDKAMKKEYGRDNFNELQDWGNEGEVMDDTGEAFS